MPFVPAKITVYTVDELIAFLKNGELTLKNIAMLKNLSLFSTDELMQFIVEGVCSLEDMQRCGLHYKKKDEINERLQLWKIEKSIWESACSAGTIDAYREYQQMFPAGHKLEEASARIIELTEKEVWITARQSDTISLYEHYLSLYPQGSYHIEAESRVRELNEIAARLREDLFADMVANPMKYTPHIMRRLFNGVEGDPSMFVTPDSGFVADKFIASGNTISYRELVERGIVSPELTEKDLLTTEFEVPQTKDFDNFPQDRTDIYFLGVPRSGKSSVLAGLFKAMTSRGNWEYVPNINAEGKDNSMAYFNGLVRSITAKKPPIPTVLDTINYINIDVPRAAGTNRTAHLNFVEISGECFKTLANSLGDSRDVWVELGASKVLANRNRKVLFFLLDYNTILGNQDGVTQADQEEALNSALTILSNDGPNPKNRTKDCTMSKVESVGVIMTKADLMGVADKEARLQVAMDYLQTNFSSFMNRLSKVCTQFDINTKVQHAPYIFTFSLGNFYVGNTLLFNYQDSMELASNIEHLVPTKKGWNIF